MATCNNRKINNKVDINNIFNQCVNYETYIKTNFSNIITDVKVLNNEDYLRKHIKYLYGIGVNEPQKDDKILLNQIKFADSCNFNNLYVYSVPKSDLQFFLAPAQKELMVNGNNIIENNEIIEVSALIQNIGQGLSEKTDVFFKINDSNIISTTPKKLNQQIGDIKPSESMALIFAFTVNNEYSGSDKLPIEITLSEKFQEYGGTFPLNLEMKKVSMTAQNIKVEGEYNKDVAIKEVSLTSDVDKNIPDSDNKNSKRYALIIGNEHYSTFQTGLKTESDVAFASNDAITFAKYAEKTLGIPSDQITLLVDAISTAMKRELNRITSLAQYSNGEAELIIYYAGHGFPDEKTKEGYIIPIEVTGTDITSGIKLADMYKQLAGANPKRVTIFLDACFSGGGRDAGLLAARGIKITPKSEPIEGNLVIFSACSAEQTSLPYSEKTHGLFTYFLLKKLQETNQIHGNKNAKTNVLIWRITQKFSNLQMENYN
jgi:hypothetical protein